MEKMKMRALELNGFDGVDSLTLVEAARPEPSPTEVLIDVKAAGMNYAELELMRQRRDATRAPIQARNGWRPSGRLLLTRRTI
jgi:NADPH2:quinone reductase